MNPQTATAWAELGSIVGDSHLHPASAADAVDGLRPQMVAEPGTVEEISQSVRLANAAGLAVVPRGGGTKLGWGNPPRRVDLVLSTTRLNRILEHAWADMTATVQAGCTVAALQQALAEHGQRLALDPLWPERATLGGILAANDSGSLRVRFGTLRDLIIGMTLVLPDGTAAKSGGKVVKNVAGYDLPKLATGSLGTLGVITETVFRLHPLPRNTRTLTFTAASASVLNKLLLDVQHSQLAFTGMQLRAQSQGPPQLDVRFEGTAAGIEAQSMQMRQLGNTAGELESPPDIWTARQSLWLSGAPIAKFSVLPSQLSAFCDLAQRLGQAQGMGWRVVAQAVGVGLLRLEMSNERALPAALAALRRETEQLGGSLVVLQAPPAVKTAMDAWGPAGDAQPLMLRVKQQLDPESTLNPGRFVGGI